MADAPRARVPTVRITRPYRSEQEFIDGDFASLARAWIILPDAPIFPAGQLVRFEVLLSTGAPVIRAEGTVVAHHAPGGPRPPGLEVRLTRIDARTKSILLRVHEKRAAIAHAVSEPPGRPAEPIAVVVPPALPAPAVAEAAHEAPAPAKQAPASAQAASPPLRKVAPPANRDEILQRLRARARALPPEKRFERSRGA